jgi:hypothetical protein
MPCFETAYLGENVKKMLKKEVAQNVTIFRLLISPNNLLGPLKSSPNVQILHKLVTMAASTMSRRY